MNDKMFQSVTMPGHAAYIDGKSYVVIDKDEFDAVVAKMSRGELFQQVAPEAVPTTATVKPANVAINVRNGAGVTGLGKIVADKLTKDGFKVKDTANMGQYVYGKTLVVYRADKDMAKATIVREELGVGRRHHVAGHVRLRRRYHDRHRQGLRPAEVRDHEEDAPQPLIEATPPDRATPLVLARCVAPALECALMGWHHARHPRAREGRASSGRNPP